MNKNYIEIKEQRRDVLVKEIFILVMMIVSLTTALFPFLSETASETPGPFFIIGGIAFLSFTAIFVYFLYKDLHPDNAIVITDKGFVDYKNVGADIVVEWTNISSIKLLGRGASPFLGIMLENSDIIMEKMNRDEADLMRENIEDGLPAILISQNDIKIPINQLKETLISFAKDARTLRNDSAKKDKKQNPFTTTAVLRAFGQVPENANETIVANDSANDISENNLPKQVNMKETITYGESPVVSKTVLEEAKQNEPDTSELKFYITDDMPDEIKEILNRPRSSKIAELGKILSEKDVPYSLIREDINVKAEPEEKIDESTGLQEEIIQETPTAQKENLKFVDTAEFIVDDEGEVSRHLEMVDFITYTETDHMSDNTFESNLDSLLKTAFDNTRQEIENQEQGITKNANSSVFDSELIPELVVFNDNDLEEMPDEFNAAQKYSTNDSADYITNIYDD